MGWPWRPQSMSTVSRRHNATFVRRAKPGASCQMKYLMYQNRASRNHRMLQNSRRQRSSKTWSDFTMRLPDWKLPPPRVIETFPTKDLHRTPKPV